MNELMAPERPGKLFGDQGALSDFFGSVSSSRIYLGITVLFGFSWYGLALYGPIWFLPKPIMPREIDLAFLGGLVIAFSAGAYGKDALMAAIPHVSAILQRLGGQTRMAPQHAPPAPPNGGDDPVNDDETGGSA